MTGLLPTNTVFSFGCCMIVLLCSEILLLGNQFCIQYARSGCATDGIVPHRDKPDSFPKSAHRYGHPVSPHPIQAGLGTVFLFFKEMYRFLWLCRRPFDGRLIFPESIFKFFQGFLDVNPDCHGMTINYRDTVAACTYIKCRICNLVTLQCAHYLEGLCFHLLLFLANVRDDIVVDGHRCNTCKPCPRSEENTSERQ